MPLAPPPLEAGGTVVPHDHPGIGDGDGVIRRISNEQIVPDPKSGGRRISSKAYNPSSGKNGGMSVDLEALIIELGHVPEIYVTTPRFMGSVYFKAHQLRAEGLSVGYDPLPDNPCHGEVWGHFTRGLKGRLQTTATWFVPIPDVSLV